MGGFFSSTKSSVTTPAVAPAVTPSTIAAKPTTPKGGMITTIVGGLILLLLVAALYNYIQKRMGKPSIFSGLGSSSGDTTPAPVDGTQKKVISETEAPAGGGSDYGIQFWMFIKDWDYKFSQEKQVVKRVSSATGAYASPYITLHPTDNSLQVRVAIYPNTAGGGAASNPSTSSTGDSFTCTVENVPLQSWFSVSVTVFQRNLDIYINGRLVKSCALPGVPKPAVGDIVIGDGGGFSGSICNLHTYTTMLGTNEAKAFFSAGTSCQAPTPTGSSVDKNSAFITLFGYTFRFSTLDKTGKELSSYTF